MAPRIYCIVIGDRFGSLVADNNYVDAVYKTRIQCTCDCGNIVTAIARNLFTGNTGSCGCARTLSPKWGGRTHGATGTSEHNIWAKMRSRCKNTRDRKYPNYGGRGISVDPKWDADFAVFLADMGIRPSKQHSIERINNDGNYEPKNCRWATALEQNRNRRKFQVTATRLQELLDKETQYDAYRASIGVL